MKYLFFVFGSFLLFLAPVKADETVTICFNYGCLTKEPVVFSDDQLVLLQKKFEQVDSAEKERQVISSAAGLLLGWAGEQTDISADKGGNLADQGVYGKMDCIDHSTTTTRLLKMMEARGLIRFHKINEPVKRAVMGVFMVHYSAAIEEKISEKEGQVAQYAVDTWFYDNGHPAVVMPLERWMSGESPNGI